MATQRFQLIFEGPAVQDGAMDIHELAPSLLSFGDLCKDVNRALNGNRAQVSVHVRSDFKRGSFLIDFDLVHTLIDQAKALLENAQVRDAQDILNALGLFIGTPIGGVLGLIQFLRWAKNRRIAKAHKNSDGTVSINIDGDGNTVLVMGDAYALYEDKATRRDLGKFIKPVTKEGIDVIKIRSEDKDVESLGKEDVEIVSEGEPAPDTLMESESSGAWQIMRPSFSDSLMWTLSDEQRNISVKVEDSDFVAKVKNGEVAFKNGDVVKGTMKATAEKTPSGLKTDYSLTDVSDIIDSPQMTISGLSITSDSDD